MKRIIASAKARLRVLRVARHKQRLHDAEHIAWAQSLLRRDDA